MRKITEKSVRNFLDGVPFKKGNMEVCREGSIYYLKLHGNKIAAKTTNGDIWISNAGWFSRTTRERLNGLPGVNIIQKKRLKALTGVTPIKTPCIWYLNGNPWNGKPICVVDKKNLLGYVSL